MMLKASVCRRFSSIRRRAVYDIGSGSIKFQIADVDLNTNKVVKNYIQKAQQVLFLKEGNNYISEGLQMEGLSKLWGLQRLSEEFGVTESIGVATEAFRNSKNGQQCLDAFQRELDFPMRIISPNEEARLGFDCTKAISEVEEDDLGVWDCGAGSYQLTSKAHEFSDKFGSGTTLSAFKNLIQRETRSPGVPVMTEQEFGALFLHLSENAKPLPAWIFAPPKEWTAVGSVHSIFNQQRILTGKGAFSPSCVEATIKDCLGLDYHELYELEKTRYALLQDRFEYDVILQNTEYILPKLTLLLSVMTRADISRLQYVQTNGNCNALLTNPQLWQHEHQEKEGGGRSSSHQVPSKPNKKPPLFTVNWHLEKDCNYKCSFCYANFDHVRKNLSLEEGFDLIQALREQGNFYKINFAGGEPLLNKNLGDYIRFAKEQAGFKTSIITNASRLTNTWLLTYGPYLDQIGISCDSMNEQVQKQLGRGFGNHLEVTKRALHRIRKVNEDHGFNIAIKLNTVVLRHNCMEDWSGFIVDNGIQRWKMFKILKITGENESSYDDLSISEEQFRIFVSRHEHLKSQGVVIAEENNDDMTQSYVMVTPDGKFYQNSSDNQYKYSENIMDVGVLQGLEDVGFDSNKFERRGGSYEL